MNAAKKEWLASNVGTLITIMLIVFGAGGSWAVCQHQLNGLATDVGSMKSQHITDHDVLTELKNDVKWIRQSLENSKRTSATTTKTDQPG